jgi:hypothetical protein
MPDAEGFVSLSAADFLGFRDPKAKGTVREATEETAREGIYRLGDARQYVYTKRPYRDFTLRLEYRWPRAADLPPEKRDAANTGVLVFITGEHKVWPKCLEVQGKWSEMGHIKSNAKDVAVTVRDDEAAREKARKPVGEWNAVEVVAKGGALTSFVNGVKIAESDPTELQEGPIGLQGEGYVVDFRNIRIREE